MSSSGMPPAPFGFCDYFDGVKFRAVWQVKFNSTIQGLKTIVVLSNLSFLLIKRPSRVIPLILANISCFLKIQFTNMYSQKGTGIFQDFY